MITLNTFKESFIDSGRRILKVIGLGGTKTANEISPFGIDANPIKNMTALYVSTGNGEEKMIVGYVNTNRIAENGEIRLYATNNDGVEQSNIYIRKNGDVELNGYAYTAVRFEELHGVITQQNADINAELSKISTAIGLIGGAYTVSFISSNMSGVSSSGVKVG